MEILEDLVNLEKLASFDSTQTIPTLDLLRSRVKKASEISSKQRNFSDKGTLEGEKTLLRGLVPYEELARKFIAGRLVVVTENGYFGSGPERHWLSTSRDRLLQSIKNRDQ